MNISFLPLWRWLKYAGRWRHQMETFSALLAICAGIHRSPVNSPYKGQWRGAFMFCLISTRMNGWVNNRESGNLRLHHAHYDVTVMTRGSQLVFSNIVCNYWLYLYHSSEINANALVSAYIIHNRLQPLWLLSFAAQIDRIEWYRKTYSQYHCFMT